jgi:hypothetical protein
MNPVSLLPHLVHRLLQFIVETFTLDYILLTGGNSLTRFMRFGSDFANH